ncbi:unnamed protein product [Caenorhabditis angaria]|uniref:protein-serine/threonine phosphatase n=2 Tax=Caenorhabditis angaria TaxID=860376 RepID=A0A9P1ILM3_9PELO|nr:unnamed protein product [Caenorhabditis angaria]
MGQTLSEPVTNKESASCANENYLVGSSCMQGWRINMEDAHTHLLSLPDDPKCAFFAVYDGHGGAKVSQYAGINLHKRIVARKEFAEGDIKNALQQGFLDLDQQMRHDEEMKDDVSGTTAVVVVIKEDQVYCGNAGDSRAVCSVLGEARPLSFDHKPANENEARRIVAAGGWVEFNRVNGNLALSRALGDFLFKTNEEKSAEEQMVTAFPDIISDRLTPDHEFIVLACDGIWDVMSNQEVVDFVRQQFAEKKDPQSICEDLLTKCLAPDCQMGGLGCDNMTVVIIGLLHGQPAENLFAKCSRQAVIKYSNESEEDTEKRIVGEQEDVTNITTGQQQLQNVANDNGNEIGSEVGAEKSDVEELEKSVKNVNIVTNSTSTTSDPTSTSDPASNSDSDDDEYTPAPSNFTV